MLKNTAGIIALIFITSIVFPVSLIGAPKSDEWVLTIDGESLELISKLEESCWMMDRPPYES